MRRAQSSTRFALRDARAGDRARLVRLMAALQDVERALHPGRADGRRVAAAHLDYLQQAAQARAAELLGYAPYELTLERALATRRRR